MTLVVFDYDWWDRPSLINDNSDTFVFKELRPALLEHLKQLTASGVQWTDAVDQTLGQLTSTTREELIEAIARVPVQPGMLEAVRFAHAQGAEVMIVSDANTVFIESMLALHSLQDIVRPVFTNPGTFDGNILRVHPFHPKADAPHGCPKCPVNMCKGSILRTIKAAKPYTKILYIGDGGGDFCPTSELSSNDYALARAEYELAKRLAASPVSVNVRTWSTGDDIFAIFRELLG